MTTRTVFERLQVQNFPNTVFKRYDEPTNAS